jgi:hypothetical protein
VTSRRQVQLDEPGIIKGISAMRANFKKSVAELFKPTARQVLGRVWKWKLS